MSELAGGYGEPPLGPLKASALVLVDVTNDFGSDDGAYARHGAPCPPLAEIFDPVKRLLESARATGRPSVLCSQFLFEDPGGKAVAADGMIAARPWLRDGGLRRGTWGTAILDGLPTPDYTIDKPRASGFFATPLDLLLRGLGVDTVVVVGAYTNQCVESTVRDAWALGYRVVLPADATACFDERLQEATLDTLRPLASVVESDAVLERWAS